MQTRGVGLGMGVRVAAAICVTGMLGVGAGAQTGTIAQTGTNAPTGTAAATGAAGQRGAAGQTGAAGQAGAAAGVPAEFGPTAEAALAAMRSRAGELKITGVAVVAYFEGDQVEGWTSRMEVVGRRKDEPTATDKGNNLIGIAYGKAAEMADTLKNSGTALRPPMTGEFGWTGGVIGRGKHGYLIAAFSGGKSEDDVKVSQAGLAAMQGRM